MLPVMISNREDKVPFDHAGSVAICDSQPVMIQGLESLLAACADIRFLKGCRSLEGAREIIQRLNPSLMIVDKALGFQEVVDWVTATALQYPSMKIVVWGNALSEPEALRLVQAGARGIVRKTAEPNVILACLRSTLAGTTWMEDALFRQSPRSVDAVTSNLTPREREIVDLVAQGLKNKEIAVELGIQPGTVKIHLKHIFEKTGVRGRYGLALSGLREKGRVQFAEV